VIKVIDVESEVFDPEDAGDTALRNVGSYTECTALYLRRWQLSK
jgi:hypothetical protein